MVSLQPPICDFGWKARPFELPGVDGKRYTLESAKGPNGLLVMFICNHCPYVKSVRDRIIRDTRELQQHGINSIAIMSNDPADYAEDSFDNMKLVAQQFNYPFPYVWDETQQIARDYGAVCTPDFFGFNANLEHAVSRPSGCFAQGSRAGCATRLVQCHAASGTDRTRAARADRQHGLFDQVER